MDLSNLSPEVRERARECKSADEVFALAREVGYEPSDEEIEGVSGGRKFETDYGGFVCHDH